MCWNLPVAIRILLAARILTLLAAIGLVLLLLLALTFGRFAGLLVALGVLVLIGHRSYPWLTRQTLQSARHENVSAIAPDDGWDAIARVNPLIVTRNYKRCPAGGFRGRAASKDCQILPEPWIKP